MNAGEPGKLCLLFVLCLASGCSLAFMPRPEVSGMYGWPACDESRALPAMDTGSAIAAGALTTALVLVVLPGIQKKSATTVSAVLAAGSAVMYGGSAVRGFGYARECRELRQARMKFMLRHKRGQTDRHALTPYPRTGGSTAKPLNILPLQPRAGTLPPPNAQDDGGSGGTWYRLFGGQEWGPLTTAEIREAIAKGEIPARGIVRKEGKGGWDTVSSFAELRDAPEPEAESPADESDDAGTSGPPSPGPAATDPGETEGQ